MNTLTHGSVESRVVIALDTGEHGDYVVELARWLTPTAARELLGIFIENESLLQQAGSRQAREVLLTGSQRALDRSVIERQIRAEAARARTLFEAATSRLGLPHRFETARGDTLLEPIRRAAGAQALVVSIARTQVFGASQRDFCRQLLEASLPLVLLARQGWLSGRSIAVVVGDADDSVLDPAARIARHTSSPLAVLVPQFEESPAERVQRNNRIREALRKRGIERSEIILLSPLSVETVLKATRALSARLLVMRSPDRMEESATVEELLRRFSGSLMLVRS